MGLKRIYNCDICSHEIKDKKALLGLHFTGTTDFTIGNYGCTEGKHICYHCAFQLLLGLADGPMRKELEEYNKQNKREN